MWGYEAKWLEMELISMKKKIVVVSVWECTYVFGVHIAVLSIWGFLHLLAVFPYSCQPKN